MPAPRHGAMASSKIDRLVSGTTNSESIPMMSPKPSHVLKELGLSKSDSNTSIRIGIGRFNNHQDIEIASESIINAIKIYET